jgi:putative FmdB family regulatory protein
MPTYDYSCPEGHTFELFQRMSDPPPPACPVCGASPVKRVLSPVAVHFKGSGFYSTDYGRGKRRDTGKDSDSAGEAKKTEEKAASASSGESSPAKGGADSSSSS